MNLLKDHSVVILDGGRRTPRVDILYENREPGLFSCLTSNQLGTLALGAALKASRVESEDVGHVIMGNVGPSHRDGIYCARHVALGAGITDAPAVTVNRLCGSGAEAIVQGAKMLLLGDMDKPFVAVGGAESMNYPHVVYGLRGRGVKYGPVTALPSGAALQDLLLLALFDPVAGMAMANTAEKLGRLYGITRAECDRLAYESHTKATAARGFGWFDKEIVPVEVPPRNGGVDTMTVRHDTHIRDDISLANLTRLPAAFEPPDGLVTAGNASGVVDGAAAMFLCLEETARERGLTRLARIVSWGYGVVDPQIMGFGPVPATMQALSRAELDGSAIDWVELNEAFAPQAAACIHAFRGLRIDPRKVNPMGGAIALGHPLGATGAILTLTCAYGLRRTCKRYGLITMCIGGGQGISLIIENLSA